MAGQQRGMQQASFLVSVHVPHATLILAAGEDPLAIRRKLNRADRIAVSGHRPQWLAARGVRNANRIVIAAAREQLSVGRESHRSHGLVMTGHLQVVCFRIGCSIEPLLDIHRLCIIRIPHHHEVVGTARSDEITVG